MRCPVILLAIMLASAYAPGQEYSVRAVDVDGGKPIAGLSITLRYECAYTGTGLHIKSHCKFIVRNTDVNGIARFPEAGSLHDIDDIFSLPIAYQAVCCDISKPEIPGQGTIKFRRRTLAEMMQWIFVGP